MQLTSITVLVSILLTQNSVLALPSLPRHTAASYEPLFKRVDSTVGSEHSIRALRSRRRATTAQQEKEERLKLASPPSPPTSSPVNTYDRHTQRLRQRRSIFTPGSAPIVDPTPVQLINPKHTTSSSLTRRSIDTPAPAVVVVNPKHLDAINSRLARRSPASSSTRNPKLVRRSTETPLVIPEARHPRYWSPTSSPPIFKIAKRNNAIVIKINETIDIFMRDPNFGDCLEWEITGYGITTTIYAPSSSATPSVSAAATSIVPLTSALPTSTSAPGNIVVSSLPVVALPLSATSRVVLSSTMSASSVLPSSTGLPSSALASVSSIIPSSSSIIPSPSSIIPSSSSTIASSSSLPSTSSAPASTSSAHSSTSTTHSSVSIPVVTTTPVVVIPAVTKWPSAANGKIAAAYYPDWYGNLPVDFSKYDLIDFAFALPDAQFNVAFDDTTNAVLLNLVARAHAANTKVLISIGGWTGSGYFSTAVATYQNRAIFIKNIVQMVIDTAVDGIDIDWEYPGTGGASGNQVSPSDTGNFLSFLQELKVALPAGQNRLSATAGENAFIGADGSPIADVTAFGRVLDNLLIMNYDVWGASSSPGPNAPLSNACANSQQPTANELSSIQTWTTAGMPASKILMGLPAYGYISASYATTLVNRRRSPHSSKTQHQEWYERGAKAAATKRSLAERAARKAKRSTVIFCPGNHSGLPCAGVFNQSIGKIAWNPLINTTILPSNITASNITGGVGGVFIPGVGVGKLGSGDLSQLAGNVINFVDLVSNGVLQEKADGSYGALNGYTRNWDPCSSTPFLTDQARGVVVTYDDPQSLKLKGALALKENIGGINMWDISGDTADYSLTNAWRKGLGL